MDIGAISKLFNSVKGALGIIKEAKDLLPDSTQKTEVINKIEEAEISLEIARAETAKALGYNLCQCKFPPEIMLFEKTKNVYKCPNPGCGHEIKKKGIIMPMSI